MANIFQNHPTSKEQLEPLVLDEVILPAVITSTVVRSLIKYASVDEMLEKRKQFEAGLQTQEMYKVISSNPVERTLILEYRCSGWPANFVLEQLGKLGSLYIKVTYMPHFSQVNKVIAKEMEKLKLDYQPVWYDVRVRALEMTNIIELSTAEQPPTTRDGKFELKWYERKPHCQGTLANGSIFLDSKLKPVIIATLSKEKVVFDQIESVASVVDAIFHLGDAHKESNVIFDIDPRNFKWADIPLDFMYHYDIQMRLHSPTTLRVFFSRRDLKNDKIVTTTTGQMSV